MAGRIGQRQRHRRSGRVADGEAEEIGSRCGDLRDLPLVRRRAARRLGSDLQGGADRARELGASRCRAQDLIEAGVDRRSTIEVKEEIAYRIGCWLSEVDAQSGFGERQGLQCHHFFRRADHAGRQRSGRRVRDAPGLTEYAHRGIENVLRNEARGCRQNERVGRERNAAFADSERELQISGCAVLRVEVEIRRHELTGAIALELELKRARIVGGDRVDRHRPRAGQMRARQTAGVERHRNRIRQTLTDVVDRDKEREGLVVPYNRRSGERHIEVRIPNQHAALTGAAHLHRSGDEAVERRLHIKVDRVEAFLLPSNQKLRFALLARGERSDIVSGPDLSVCTGGADRLRWKLRPLVCVGERERVIDRVRKLVCARRQFDRTGHIVNREIRSAGRAVRDEQLRREELLQISDVARDDQDARDAHRFDCAVRHRDRRLLNIARRLEKHRNDRRQRRHLRALGSERR